MSTAKTTKKQGFQKGKSGNPDGRPNGSRNKATIALESLLEGQAVALTQKAVDMAMGGDTQALRICMERICPPRKSRPVSIVLPKVETAQDVAEAHAAVIAAMAAGEVTPDEANTIAGVLEAKRRSVEAADNAERMKALEEKVKKILEERKHEFN